MPVAGSVTSPYGYRVHPIYGYYSLHDGTDFGAGCGQPLWAVAGGTVTDEYYSSVWGNRLYLSLGNVNGKNVTVIYNHLSGYRASVGEGVARGETVGYVGTTGWSTGCHLHFTVLVNGDPVDPMGWIGSLAPSVVEEGALAYSVVEEGASGLHRWLRRALCARLETTLPHLTNCPAWSRRRGASSWRRTRRRATTTTSTTPGKPGWC